MTYKVLLIHLLLLGYSNWVVGQGQNVGDRSSADAVQSPGGSSYGAGEEDEEEESSAMTRLQNVTSLDEFIAMLHRDGNPVSTSDIFSNYTDESGRVYISTGGRMAQPDDCSPRDTTVRLTFDNSNPNIIYFPRCTKIERCGGCCASPHLECMPSYTERVSYKILKAEQPYPGSNHLEWKGEYHNVILDRHVTCRVQCTLTPDKCGPKKDFQERQCGCKCRRYERCLPPKVWDPEECECRCAEVLACCTHGVACGLTFSKDTCECIIDPPTDVDNHLMIISNMTQEQIDAYFASLNNTAISSSTTTSSTATTTAPTTTASTTTATTTTTTITTDSTVTATTATTTATAANTAATVTNTTGTTNDTITLIQASDPCLTTRCPGNFAKVAFNATTCACRRIIGGIPRRIRTTVPPLR